MKTTVAALGMVAALCGHAQTPGELLAALEGTMQVIPHRVTADGALRACGFEFNAVGRDSNVRPVTAVKINGSYYLRRHEDRLIWVLKLGAWDGLAASPRAGYAPANAFVRPIRGNGPKSKPHRSAAEDPGYALFVGTLDEDATALYGAILEEKSFIVGFNRQPGRQDVNIKVDLTVTDAKLVGDKIVREQSDEAIKQFVYCTSDLFDAVRGK